MAASDGTSLKKNCFWESAMVTVSYLVHYETLLQNATEIITKCDKSLLQNALGILFQNATVLLQNVTVVTKCVDFIINCNSYYKMRRLLQNALIHKFGVTAL